jgi:hypothetical protein
MPKRSEREEYSSAFKGENPFKNKNPIEIYNIIQWGNKPKNIFPINAPEPLISLGHLAKLFFEDETYLELDENQVHITIGANSNIIYFFPYGTRSVPSFNKKSWLEGNKIIRTDYFSEKGGEPCYYYHNHEIPYPTIWYHKTVSILLPDTYKNKPSYAVIKEGIVG